MANRQVKSWTSFTTGQPNTMKVQAALDVLAHKLIQAESKNPRSEKRGQD